MSDPFDAFQPTIDKWTEEARKFRREKLAYAKNQAALAYGERLVAMFDFGFLCRHGIIYGQCDECMGASGKAQVRCPWAASHKTVERDGEKIVTCPACKGSGFVEELVEECEP
jgi:hypothetical protein